MRLLLLAVGASSLAALAFGAVPIANVSSSETFELRGHMVPVEGVTSWPVLAGDRIHASTSNALIRFADGSTITLYPGSTATVDSDSVDHNSFHLIAGSMALIIKAPKNLSVFSAGSPVEIHPGKQIVVSAAGKPGSSGGARPMLALPPRHVSGR